MQPTRNQLIADALRRVVLLQFEASKIRDELRRAYEARLKALTPRQTQLLLVQYNTLITNLIQQLTALVNAIVAEGPSQAKCALTDAELTAIISATTATLTAPGKQITNNCTYLFNNMIYTTPTWSQVQPLIDAAKLQLKALLDEADTLAGALDLKVQNQDQEYTNTRAMVQNVRQRVSQLTTVPNIGTVLGPLIDHVNDTLDGLILDLNECTGAKLRGQFDVLHFTFCGAADHTLAAEEAWPFYQICLDQTVECNILLNQLAPQLFTTLSNQIKSKTQVTYFGELLQSLGGPGFFAFIQCSTTVQIAVVSRWDSLGNELLKKVPANEREVATLKFSFECMAVGATWKDGWTALLSGSRPKITLPGGITSAGWRLVNTCMMPRAFSHASFETDPVCMKHCVQELGNAPSQTKVTNYFAQLCTASGQGYLRWGQLGRTHQKIQIMTAGVTWSFLFKINTQANQVVIYHIDSGYQNSPWVNRPQ